MGKGGKFCKTLTPVELKGNRKELISLIEKNPEGKIFTLKVKPSKSVFAFLLSKTNAKKLIVSRGIWKTVPEKVREALKSSGIRVSLQNARRGPKRKVSEKRILDAIRLLGKGESLKNAANRVGLGKAGLCYRLKKYKRKNSRRRKYVAFKKNFGA